MISAERQTIIKNAVDYYFNNDIKVAECAKLFGIHRCTLGKYIRLKDPEYNTRRKYDIDKHFFDSIDTEEKAYILGFLTADGCIKSQYGCIKLALTKKDEEILEKMRAAMKYEKPLDVTHKAGFNSIYSTVEMNIACKEMYDKLVEYGFSVNKTFHEKFCEKVPKELIRHYIRGIFDGDGWFSYNESNKWCEFGIGMGKDILESIKNIFDKEFKIPPLKYQIRQYKSIYRLRISSAKYVEKIFHYFYDDANIYLQRKHEKMKIVCRSKTKVRKSLND